MKKNPLLAFSYERLRKSMDREMRNERLWNRRHGIIDNHLCARCDRIIAGNRRFCCACISHAVEKLFREKRENGFKRRRSKTIDKEIRR